MIGVTFRESDAVFGLVLMNAGMQNVRAREGQLLALSSRTWADRDRPQRIGYDAVGEPVVMNEADICAFEPFEADVLNRRKAAIADRGKPETTSVGETTDAGAARRKSALPSANCNCVSRCRR